MTNLTIEQFKQMVPNCKESEIWYNLAIQYFDQYEINTETRIAMFIAQMSVECGEFNTLHENLNYSAESLLKLFPTHFNQLEANEYAHNPEKIANRVYANRYR